MITRTPDVEMFMKRVIFFISIFLSSHFIHAAPAIKDSKGFISRVHAMHCIQLSQDVSTSKQHLLNFETRKVNLKSKIDYLHNEIRIRREKIEALDQRNYQSNNKNYNQLIDQFESLIEERKQAIAQYDRENQQHVSHNAEDINLQNTYIEQCLNNTKISKNLHNEICLATNNLWCKRFIF